jgi:ArsR family transcriptional regulator, arsenate/arsenite/antimonite-responsive transcriptional repressor
MAQELEIIAGRMAELGHPTRLQVLKHLVRAGPAGTAVGDIQAALGIPGSTLSHHIARLMKVGLVQQVRESRTLYCFPVFDAVQEVITFLMAECCADCEPGGCSD